MFAMLTLLWLAPAPVGPVAPAPTTEPPPEFETRDAPEYEDPVAKALAVVPGGLTAEQAAVRAGRTAPSVESKLADADVAQARVDQTTYAAIPTLNATASYTRLSPLTINFGSGALVGAMNAGPLGIGACPGGTGQCVVDAMGVPVGAASFKIPVFLNQWSLGASLIVPISDYALRVTRGLQAARQNKKSAELLVEAERLKVETDARLAYYQWVRAIASVAVAEDALVRAQARVTDAKASFNAGVLAKADLLRIETLVANAENTVLQAKAMLQYSEAALETAMGEEGKSYRIGEDVLGDVSPGERGDVDDHVDEATRNRYEMKALGQSTQALRNAAKAERSGYFPRFDLFGDAVYANPNQRIFPQQQKWRGTWAVGARISYSINGPLVARGRVKELKAQRRNVDAQIETLRRALKLEVTSAYFDRERAFAALGAARKAREASEESYRATSALFRVGKATATELVVAEADRVNARLQDVNARVDLRVAETRLRYATGNMPRAR
ncbi:MAG TPA: TolC family protein [Nannocystaceae bacterium]|nr:TolC family protein [Nannocystaceae bacterium]